MMGRNDVAEKSRPSIVRHRPDLFETVGRGTGEAARYLRVGYHPLPTAPYREVPSARGDYRDNYFVSDRTDQRGDRLKGEGFHRPAMVDEVLEWLAPQRGGLFLDGTVGGGGHAEAMLRAARDVRLLAVDRDIEALARARERLSDYGGRLRFAEGDYGEAGELFDLGEGALAGVLLDLGVSSHQIDTLERGFTFRPGAPLDMRMSRRRSEPTAADLLANLDVDELSRIFKEYGEEKRARRLARAVVAARVEEPLRTSDDLVRLLEEVWGRSIPAAEAARIFQALRIEVNEELAALEGALPELRDLLAPGGRMVVISYHSLEDRRVKRAFRAWSRECICPPGLPVCRCRGHALGHEPVRGPLRPSPHEVEENPRARSARLRVWERGR